MLRCWWFLRRLPGRLAEIERRVADLEAGRPRIVRVGGERTAGDVGSSSRLLIR